MSAIDRAALLRLAEQWIAKREPFEALKPSDEVGYAKLGGHAGYAVAEAYEECGEALKAALAAGTDAATVKDSLTVRTETP